MTYFVIWSRTHFEYRFTREDNDILIDDVYVCGPFSSTGMPRLYRRGADPVGITVIVYAVVTR